MDPFDLSSIFGHRALLEALEADGSSAMHTVGPPPSVRSVALLPGSFNPATAAHALLAERAMREGCDHVAYVLARDTAGKEQTGLIPEDRLLTLETLTQPGIGVAVVSHGLYADQADAAARAFPGAELSFLVGSDKVFQIFDPEWYEDREDALDRLFSRARLLVAPRCNEGEHLQDVLADARNRRWADNVEVLRLHPAVGDLSSTHVRGLLRSGAEPAGLVPASVASFVAAVRAFAPPLTIGSEEVDSYGLRAALIDVLWSIGAESVGTDLRALFDLAVSERSEGAALRAQLRAGTARAEDVVRAIAAARG